MQRLTLPRDMQRSVFDIQATAQGQLLDMSFPWRGFVATASMLQTYSSITPCTSWPEMPSLDESFL